MRDLSLRRVQVLVRRLDRATATHNLPDDAARILQRVNIARLSGGRMIRGYGAARTQAAPSANTVTSAFAGRQPNGNFIALAAANGSVLAYPNSSYGPAEQWNDQPNTPWNGKDTEKIDFGNDEKLFTINLSQTFTYTNTTFKADLVALKNFTVPNAAAATQFGGTPLISGLMWAGGIASTYTGLFTDLTDRFVGKRQGMVCSGRVSLSGAGSQTITLTGAGGKGDWYFASNADTVNYTVVTNFNLITAIKDIEVLNSAGLSTIVKAGATYANIYAGYFTIRKAVA